MQITVDSSVIMAVILNEATKPRLLDLTRGAELQSAPSLPWEVGNGLSALFRRDRIDLDQAEGALRSFRQIPVRLSEVDLESAVGLAEEHGIYAYDAYVLECATRYRTPLLSLDRSQCAVARKMGIEVLEV
jgi:predicted nucleic acid-binding protein